MWEELGVANILKGCKSLCPSRMNRIKNRINNLQVGYRFAGINNLHVGYRFVG